MAKSVSFFFICVVFPSHLIQQQHLGDAIEIGSWLGSAKCVSMHSIDIHISIQSSSMILQQQIMIATDATLFLIPGHIINGCMDQSSSFIFLRNHYSSFLPLLSVPCNECACKREPFAKKKLEWSKTQMEWNQKRLSKSFLIAESTEICSTIFIFGYRGLLGFRIQRQLTLSPQLRSLCKLL